MTAASTANDLFDRYRVIDVDTHLTEPPDVWTARVAAKWGDLVPHIERRDGEDAWVVGDKVIFKPGFVSMAGFDGTVPEHPATYDDIPAACFESGCPAQAHGRSRHLRAGALPERRRLRFADLPAPRRAGPDAGMRRRLQRLPHRLDGRRPRIVSSR